MKPKNPYSRRKFLQISAATSLTAPFAAWCTPPQQRHPQHSSKRPPAKDPFSIHLFSKHLQFLDYEAMADKAAEIGFDGLDLTVRPNGHVEPEKVEKDLPRAIAAIKKAGLNPLMMTTAVDEVNPVNKTLLETASAEGIHYYRPNWFRYPDDITIPEAIEGFKDRMAALSELNVGLNLEGSYQNHSGRFVGASLWEVYEMLEKVDPQGMGVQYDIRHATVEGGLSWPTELRLIEPHIKTLVFKDFIWVEKEGKWRLQNVPLGEGMVDFDAYFQEIKKYDIQAPISLHLEYDLGGANSGKREITIPQEEVYAFMKKDLETLKAWLDKYELVAG